MMATVAETIPVGTVGPALASVSFGRRTARPSRGRQLLSGLQDAIALLVIVWSIPFAMLLVSAPLALAIALLVRLASWALNVH